MQTAPSDKVDPDPTALRVAPRRRWGRWIIVLIGIWLAALVVRAVYDNPNIDYAVVGDYLFASRVMDGLVKTLQLTAVSMGLAVIIGVALAAMRLSGNPFARTVAWFYIWIMRSVPVLLQLIIWFNLALLFQHVNLGIPGTDLTLASWETNAVVTPFVAAALGLGLAESAYYSEIVRSGLLSVDRGQTEAAKASGMTAFETFRLITFPQAFRIIIPPTGNELIGVLKYSSLASIIGFTELTGTAQEIYAENLNTIELLMVVSIWYIVCTGVLSVGQYFLERRFGRGTTATAQRSLGATVRAGLRFGRA